MSVKTISNVLVSQPKPTRAKSPFFDLADRYNLRVDFRPFIHVEGIPAKEFRKTRIAIDSYSSVILNSKTAVDHYFRVCSELKIEADPERKYFCISDSVAVYLQKYIQMRKRKVHIAKGVISQLHPMILKHAEESYIMPCSDVSQASFVEELAAEGIKVQEAVMYKTVCSDLSDLTNIKYDIIVFYSPSGIKSLFENYPDFKQEDRGIAVFGTKTRDAALEAGLNPTIQAPAPGLPSMTMAIEHYIKQG